MPSSRTPSFSSTISTHTASSMNVHKNDTNNSKTSPICLLVLSSARMMQQQENDPTDDFLAYQQLQMRYANYSNVLTALQKNRCRQQHHHHHHQIDRRFGSHGMATLDKIVDTVAELQREVQRFVNGKKQLQESMNHMKLEKNKQYQLKQLTKKMKQEKLSPNNNKDPRRTLLCYSSAEHSSSYYDLPEDDGEMEAMFNARFRIIAAQE